MNLFPVRGQIHAFSDAYRCRNVTSGNDLPLFQTFVLYFTQQVGCEDEVVQPFVGGGEYIVLGSFPFLVSLVDVKDAVADAHYGVHVVGIDDGGHVVLGGDVMNQGIDNQRGLRVESRVRLVAAWAAGRWHGQWLHVSAYRH